MYSESILIKIGFDLKRRGFTRVPRTRSSTFRMPPYLFTDIVTCRIDNATTSAEYYLLDDILILEQSLFDVRGWPQLIAIGMELPGLQDILEMILDLRTSRISMASILSSLRNETGKILPSIQTPSTPEV